MGTVSDQGLELKMSQRILSEQQFHHKRKTRKREFLERMERLVPWQELEAVIEPYYPRNKRGRPTIGLSRMLRMYFLQQWFNLSDEATEEALYDIPAFALFVGVDLSRERAPDATTLLRFRHLLERHRLTEALFEKINRCLAEEGLLLKSGTVVDATIIQAPSSTKNRDKSRDPDMHSTKKGNQWYFGMKAHIGADLQSGLVHSLKTTAANVADVCVGPELLHGEETMVFADAGYQGLDKRLADQDGKPACYVAKKRSVIQKLPEDFGIQETAKTLERLKAKVRAWVEHPFHIVKCRFGYRKVRYRGLAKNTAHLFTLFGLANLLLADRVRCGGLRFAGPTAV